MAPIEEILLGSPAHRESWAQSFPFRPSNMGMDAQLYAVRSRESWGIGDLADLRRLRPWARSLGTGLVLVNHWMPSRLWIPQEASPYSPSS